MINMYDLPLVPTYALPSSVLIGRLHVVVQLYVASCAVKEGKGGGWRRSERDMHIHRGRLLVCCVGKVYVPSYLVISSPLKKF